jgi:hypothetical protein
MAIPPNTVLKAILSSTPAAERAAVCAAWDGLLPERREFLATWSPEFVAGWLRGLLQGWDDEASLNTLPEGGYARRVAVSGASGQREWVWCRVATASATVGELIPCEERLSAHGARISFELHADGQAVATSVPMRASTPQSESRPY